MWIFLVFLVLSIIVLFITRERSIIEPAKLFTVYWITQILLISVVFVGIYDFSGIGFIYILVACIIFLISSAVGKSLAYNLEVQEERFEFNLIKSNKILVFITIIAFVYPFLQISRYGFGLQYFFNIDSLLEMNDDIASNRYTGGELYTLFDQLLLVFVYLSPLYAGYISTFSEKRKWLYYLVFLPALIVALSQAMKLSFISSVFLWFSGKIVAMYSSGRSLPRLNFKRIFIVLSILISFFGLLFFSMLLRLNEINSDTIQIASYKFINYSLGHLAAFDNWISINLFQSFPTDFKTFYGISNYFGFANRDQGVFTEFFEYGGNKFPEEMVTNVYTVFRFLIEDFNIWGSLIFMSVIGIISGYVFNRINNFMTFFTSKVILSFFYFFVFLSFATSAMAYTSYIVVFILFYFVLRISYYPNPSNNLNI